MFLRSASSLSCTVSCRDKPAACSACPHSVLDPHLQWCSRGDPLPCTCVWKCGAGFCCQGDLGTHYHLVAEARDMKFLQ